MLYSQLRTPIQEIKHKQTTRIDRVLAVTTVRWPIQSNNADIQYTEDYLSVYILPSNTSIAD